MNATPHKHAAFIKQWADAPEWWDVYYFSKELGWRKVEHPSWVDSMEYELHKSAKHPDNIKPKKRLIDWSKMPVGTMTDNGELRGFSDEMFIIEVVRKGEVQYHYSHGKHLRLDEQNRFTYWQGGECPVPDGVVIECVRRDGSVFKTAPTHPEAIAYDWQHDFGDQDIIGYRIIGLAEGWTDDPSEAA